MRRFVTSAKNYNDSYTKCDYASPHKLNTTCLEYTPVRLHLDVYAKARARAHAAGTLSEAMDDAESLLSCGFVTDGFAKILPKCYAAVDTIRIIWGGFAIICFSFLCMWAKSKLVVTRLNWMMEHGHCLDHSSSKVFHRKGHTFHLAELFKPIHHKYFHHLFFGFTHHRHDDAATAEGGDSDGLKEHALGQQGSAPRTVTTTPDTEEEEGILSKKPSSVNQV
jgi:hypothetical protein